MAAGNVVRDAIHPDWLGWEDYKTAYFLEEEWFTSCFVWYSWSLVTCLCSLPLPWGQGAGRGGDSQVLIHAVGLPLGVGVLPAIDIVSRNARRARRHRLLGGNKEII